VFERSCRFNNICKDKNRDSHRDKLLDDTEKEDNNKNYDATNDAATGDNNEAVATNINGSLEEEDMIDETTKSTSTHSDDKNNDTITTSLDGIQVIAMNDNGEKCTKEEEEEANSDENFNNKENKICTPLQQFTQNNENPGQNIRVKSPLSSREVEKISETGEENDHDLDCSYFEYNRSQNVQRNIIDLADFDGDESLLEEYCSSPISQKADDYNTTKTPNPLDNFDDNNTTAATVTSEFSEENSVSPEVEQSEVTSEGERSEILHSFDDFNDPMYAGADDDSFEDICDPVLLAGASSVCDHKRGAGNNLQDKDLTPQQKDVHTLSLDNCHSKTNDENKYGSIVAVAKTLITQPSKSEKSAESVAYLPDKYCFPPSESAAEQQASDDETVHTECTGITFSSEPTEVRANIRPTRVVIIDDEYGIARGDCIISLFNPYSGKTQQEDTGDNVAGLKEIIWKLRELRRGDSKIEDVPVDSSASNAVPSLRLKLPVDVDKARVLRGTKHIKEIESAAIQYLKNDEFDEAEDLFQEILSSYVERFMKESKKMEPTAQLKAYEYQQVICVVLHNLGVIKLLMSDYDEALNHFQKALSVQEPYLGSDHIEIVPTLLKLGVSRYAAGEYSEAESAFRRCLEISHKKSPNSSDRAQLAEILNNLACTQYCNGNFDDALSSLGDSMQIQCEILDESLYSESDILSQCIMTKVSMIKCNIGCIHLDQGQPSLAIGAFQSALMVRFLLTPLSLPFLFFSLFCT